MSNYLLLYFDIVIIRLRMFMYDEYVKKYMKFVMKNMQMSAKIIQVCIENFSNK